MGLCKASKTSALQKLQQPISGRRCSSPPTLLPLHEKFMHTSVSYKNLMQQFYSGLCLSSVCCVSMQVGDLLPLEGS